MVESTSAVVNETVMDAATTVPDTTEEVTTENDTTESADEDSTTGTAEESTSSIATETMEDSATTVPDTTEEITVEQDTTESLVAIDPTGIEALLVTNSSFNITFDDLNGATGYKVRIIFNGTDESTKSGTPPIQFTELSPGTNYTIVVTAFFADGNRSAQLFQITAPASPTNIQQSANTSDTIDVTFDVVFSANRYYSELFDSDDNRLITTQESYTNFFTFTNLTPGSFYEVRIKAENDGGNSSTSIQTGLQTAAGTTESPSESTSDVDTPEESTTESPSTDAIATDSTEISTEDEAASDASERPTESTSNVATPDESTAESPSTDAVTDTTDISTMEILTAGTTDSETEGTSNVATPDESTAESPSTDAVTDATDVSTEETITSEATDRPTESTSVVDIPDESTAVSPSTDAVTDATIFSTEETITSDATDRPTESTSDVATPDESTAESPITDALTDATDISTEESITAGTTGRSTESTSDVATPDESTAESPSTDAVTDATDVSTEETITAGTTESPGESTSDATPEESTDSTEISTDDAIATTITDAIDTTTAASDATDRPTESTSNVATPDLSPSTDAVTDATEVSTMETITAGTTDRPTESTSDVATPDESTAESPSTDAVTDATDGSTEESITSEATERPTESTSDVATPDLSPSTDAVTDATDISTEETITAGTTDRPTVSTSDVATPDESTAKLPSTDSVTDATDVSTEETITSEATDRPTESTSDVATPDLSPSTDAVTDATDVSTKETITAGTTDRPTESTSDVATPDESTVESPSTDAVTDATDVSTEETIIAIDPTGIEAQIVTNSSFSITFDNLNGATGYVVRILNDADSTTESGNPPIEFTELSPGTNYTITVTAIFAVGNRSKTIYQITAPASPTNIQQSVKTSNSIGVTFDVVASANRYYSELFSESMLITKQESDTNSFTFTELTPGSFYEIRIIAENDGGNSSTAIQGGLETDTTATDAPTTAESFSTDITPEDISTTAATATDSLNETSANVATPGEPTTQSPITDTLTDSIDVSTKETIETTITNAEDGSTTADVGITDIATEIISTAATPGEPTTKPSSTDVIATDSTDVPTEETITPTTAESTGVISTTDSSPGVDECANGEHNCHDNATCTNTISSFNCTCKGGFAGNGTSCEDIDECTENTHDCDVTANCANTDGSFECTCIDGYTGSGVTCNDIDECDTDTDDCHDTLANCNNTEGSFECTCIDGYTGSGVTCNEIDECVEGTDDCHDTLANCTNTDGSFECACKDGYTGSGVTCNDVDECATAVDDCHDTLANCNNTDGSFECTCKDGYTGSGVTCSDIDECVEGTDDCHDTLANCNNTDGSFECTCKDGYTGSGVTCNDINECDDETDDCDTNAKCENELGSFNCSCNDGYTGTGTECDNIDECATGADDCHGTLAECNDTEGSYVCTCIEGYTGDGVTCIDIDECTEGLAECVRNSECLNNDGSYTCPCLEGYGGDGLSSSCQLIETPELDILIAETDLVVGEIKTIRRHQLIKVTVTDEEGQLVSTVNTTDLDVTVKNLEDGTNYYISAVILVLNNGFSVNANASEGKLFTTKKDNPVANCRSQDNFVPGLRDRRSPVFIEYVSIFTIAVQGNNFFIVNIVIRGFFPGSIVAVMEIETNTTSNKTIDDIEVTNSNFTVSEVARKVDPAPENITVTSVTTFGFHVSWSAVPMATTYDVIVSAANFSITYTTANASVSIGNLTSNTVFCVTIQATIADNATYRLSNVSDPVVVTTGAEGPGNLNIEVLTGNSIVINFDAVATSELYYIIFPDASEHNFKLTGDDVINNLLSKQVDGLTPDTPYNVEVIAEVGDMNSTTSTTSATTGPETVSGIFIYNLDSDGFNVEHDAVEIVPSIETTYKIQYISDNGTRTVDSNVTDTFVPANDPAKILYNVSAAYTTRITSPFSPTVSSKIWDIDTLESTRLSVSWRQYKDVTVYNVSVYPEVNSTFEINATNTELNGLVGGTEYYIAVTVEEKMIFNISQLTCPSPVTGLRCSPYSIECIEVTWSKTMSVHDYSASVAENKFADVTVDVDAPSAVICNLTTGTNYTANVVAINEACDSESTSVISCMTDVNECTNGDHNCHDNATCDNTLTSFNCTCKEGFSGNGTFCKDVDECVPGADNNCHNDATCSNTIGSYTCDCNEGYSGNGSFCEDINECVEETDNCHNNATCKNLIPLFSCECNEGFSGNGTSCEDDDECAPGADNNCHNNATCSNTIGSYRCDCNEGYSGNGSFCEDINECVEETDNCHNNATCKNLIPRFSCECNEGFSGNGTSCEDVDECASGADNNCHTNATCRNSIGSYTCVCNEGYSGNGSFCEDDDECSGSNDCNTNANCTNAPGTFSCTCLDGYGGDGRTCEDINECDVDTDNCHSFATCTNLIPLFSCECNQGFNGDGTSCEDKDECEDESNNCHVNATCVNEVGSFSCGCNRGFTGNGVNCEDINECEREEDKCHIEAICKNMIPFYTCDCNEGFSGNGTSCEDIDECSGENDCDPNAKCNNTAGSYTCTCKSGFTGNGRRCEDIDECEVNSDDCANNANCLNAVGNYSCECKDGFSGIPNESCVEIETVSLTTIMLLENEAIFGISSTLSHKEYKVQLYSEEGDMISAIIEINEDERSVRIVSLEASTTYQVTIQVTKLSNNAVVTGNLSSPQHFTTKPPTLLATAKLFDEVFDTDLQNRESAVFRNIVNILGNFITNNPGLDGFILGFRVLILTPGSVVCTLELETNSSSTLTIANATVNSSFALDEIAPSALASPVNLTVSDVTTSTFSVQWVAVSGAIQYVVDVECDNISQSYYVESNSADVSGIPANTQLVVSIRAVVNTTTLEVTNRSEPLIVATLDDGPDNLVLAVLSDSSIRVDFDVVPGANTYFVSFLDEPAFDFTLSGVEVVEGKFSHQVDGLTPSQTYTISVVALVSGQNGTSSTATATLGPSEVSGMFIFAVNDTSFSIQFDAVVLANTEVTYVVRYISGDNVFEKETDIPMLTISPERFNTTYDVSVAYKTATKTSNFSLVLSTDVYDISTVTADAITVSWTSTPFTPYLVDIEPTDISPEQISETTKTFTGLNPGTEYTINVGFFNERSIMYFTAKQTTVPGPVAGIQCLPSNETCFSLTWNKATSATSYDTEINQGTVTDANINANHTLPGAEICRIDTGALYNATIFALNSAGKGVGVDKTGCHSVLPAPVGTTISATNQTCFTVSWDPISEAISYSISLESSAAATVSGTTDDSTSILLCDLQAGTTYDSSITATYEAGESLRSAVVASQITAPPTPVEFSVTDVTVGSISLSWSTASTATLYYVKRTDASEEKTVSTEGTTITIDSLSAGTVYSFTVTALNDGGNSTESTELQQITTPEAVTDFVVDTANVEQLYVPMTWSASSGAESYNLTVSKDGDEISVANVIGTSWDAISGLEDGETYNVSIVAITAATGIQQISAETILSFLTAPPTPVDITTRNITKNGMVISWVSSKSAEYYEVNVEQSNPSNSSNTKTFLTTSEEVTVEDLLPGHVYTIMVRANNTGGWSLASSGVQQVTVPEAVSNLDVNRPVQQFSFLLTWDQVIGANSYQVTISSNGTNVATKNPTENRVTFEKADGIEAGKIYVATVITVTGMIGSQETSTATTLDFETAPMNSSEPAETASTENSISVVWEAGSGADYYSVNVIHSNGDRVNSTNVSTSSITIENLEGGILYTVQIIGHNEFGQSSVIQGKLWTNPSSPNYSISDITTESFKLGWPSVTGAFGYSVQVFIDSTNELAPYVLKPSFLRELATEAVVSNLDAGIVYRVQMKAHGDIKDSVVRSTTQITVSDAPVITLTSRATTSLGVSWEEITGADSYRVSYRRGPSSPVEISESVSTTNFLGEELSPGILYTVSVSSVNAAGSKEATEDYATVIASGPEITISDWTENTFSVAVAEDVLGRVTYDYMVSPGSSSRLSVDATSVSIIDLQPGTDYTVTIFTNYDIDGRSSGSVPKDTTTLFGPPANFRVISNTQVGGITLSWTELAGAINYQIAVSGSSGDSFVTNSVNSPATISDIVLGTNYTFTLRAENKINQLGVPRSADVVAAVGKKFEFQLTMNNSFAFTETLNDPTSADFIRLNGIIEQILRIILNLKSIDNIRVTRFLSGSVIAWVEITVNDPSVVESELVTKYTESTEDKSTFTVETLTTNLNECLLSPCHEKASCTNTDASYTCACDEGYTGNGIDSCVDDKECDRTPSPCDDNAECSNTDGSYTCTCNVGFEGNGRICEDVNECPDACSGISICENNFGSFVCTCQSGYTYNEVTCIDNNECETSPCDDDAICENNPGSYICTCNEGYSGDGTVCNDVDECSNVDRCEENESCYNTIGSYFCSCEDGYAGDPCEDVDECLFDGICNENANCSNNVGSFTCTCKEGFTEIEIGSIIFCYDVNPCDVVPCATDATCFNQPESFECRCNVGYSGDGIENCTDIDECDDESNCDGNATCTNTIGSHYCTCNGGYNGDGATCTDNNECEIAGICHEYAECFNEPGSYRCECTTGFTGSANFICTDIDECVQDSNICSDINSNCMNTFGSFDCVCNDGYETNEISICGNINECNLSTPPCPTNSQCNDTGGSFICTCNTGYIGEDCADDDECELGKDNCHAQANCSNTQGSFTCTCKEGYSGDGVTCISLKSTVTLQQTITKYAYHSGLARNRVPAEINYNDLEALVRTQIEEQFHGFTVTAITFTSGTSTSIIVTYIMETSLNIAADFIEMYYDATAGNTDLFATDPKPVSECQDGSRNCGKQAFCVSAIVSGNVETNCYCLSGYENVSNACADVDECGKNPPPCDTNALCTNLNGSYSCACSSGYVGEGSVGNCADINECSTPDICSTNSQCINSEGSYSCVCEPGYVGVNGSTCEAQCTDGYCQNGGTCVPSVDNSTPTCRCTSQFEGERCGQSSVFRNLAIAFGVLGGLFLLILIVVLVYVCISRKKRQMNLAGV